MSLTLLTSVHPPERKNKARALIRPFPISLVPLFQNESKCKTFHSHFRKKGNSHLDSLWNRGTRELGNGPLFWVKNATFILLRASTAISNSAKLWSWLFEGLFIKYESICLFCVFFFDSSDWGAILVRDFLLSVILYFLKEEPFIVILYKYWYKYWQLCILKSISGPYWDVAKERSPKFKLYLENQKVFVIRINHQSENIVLMCNQVISTKMKNAINSKENYLELKVYRIYRKPPKKFEH